MPTSQEVVVPDATPAEQLGVKVDAARRAMMHFLRIDRVFNWIEELAEEMPEEIETAEVNMPSGMPVLETSIRGPDGSPMQVAFDTTTWSPKDQKRIVILLQRNASSDYGPALEQIAAAAAEANNEYQRQVAAASTRNG